MIWALMTLNLSLLLLHGMLTFEGATYLLFQRSQRVIFLSLRDLEMLTLLHQDEESVVCVPQVP